MDYKKNLKMRLYIGISYIVLGIILIILSSFTNSNKDFMSSFGLILAVLGAVRIRNYFIITKNEDTIRKQKIIETDERTISIIHKAKSATFTIYISIMAAATIALSIMDMHEISKWLSYSVCLMVAIYWVCYFIYQKRS